jgi:hypothetical protein
VVCIFYTVQKLHGGRLPAGAGCFVIQAGGLSAFVRLSHYRGGVALVGVVSGGQRGH